MSTYNRVYPASILDAFAGNGALTGAAEEVTIAFTRLFRVVGETGRKIARARKRVHARRELEALDDRILADIGISRGSIRATVDSMIR